MGHSSCSSQQQDKDGECLKCFLTLTESWDCREVLPSSVSPTPLVGGNLEQRRAVMEPGMKDTPVRTGILRQNDHWYYQHQKKKILFLLSLFLLYFFFLSWIKVISLAGFSFISSRLYFSFCLLIFPRMVFKVGVGKAAGGFWLSVWFIFNITVVMVSECFAKWIFAWFCFQLDFYNATSDKW